MVKCIRTPKASYDLLTKTYYIANHQLRKLIKESTTIDSWPNFLLTLNPSSPTNSELYSSRLDKHLQEIYAWTTEEYTALISLPVVTVVFFFFLEFFTADIYTDIYIHFCFTCVIVWIFIQIG